MHFDISPDGQYLIAGTDQLVLTLVRIAPAVEPSFPTPSISQRLMAPSWKP
jgi:hypothetical protein